MNKGFWFIFLSAILFGSYGVWSRLMGDTFAPFYQTWVRSIIIVLLMLPFMLIGKSFRRIDRKDWPAFSVYIFFCIFTQVPLYYAYNHASLSVVQLIFYSVFVITAYLVGKFYLQEKITRIKLVAMALAFIGLVIIFGESVLIFAPLGLAAGALNGVASGGEVASSKKILEKYSPALVVFWGWIWTIIVHLPFSFLLGETQHVPQLSLAWLWLLIYAVVNALAFWLIIAGYRYVDASIGSLIGLSEIIFAAIFGAVIFHEALTWSIIWGGMFILIAGTLPDLLALVKRYEKR